MNECSCGFSNEQEWNSRQARKEGMKLNAEIEEIAAWRLNEPN